MLSRLHQVSTRSQESHDIHVVRITATSVFSARCENVGVVEHLPSYMSHLESDVLCRT